MKACYSGYTQCALWSSTDFDGTPLDDFQLSDEANETLRAQLDEFIEYCETNYSEILQEYEELGGTPEQFAHDFWLTRNGHGAGFWDRGLGEVGDALTGAAKSFGECVLYLNEDTYEVEVY